ncbi:MAG: nuclease-related domain-containing protein [Archangium sp.]
MASSCAVDGCKREINKKGHTLCKPHWSAQQNGQLGRCENCGALTEAELSLCSKCAALTESSNRKAGQGARDIADALAKQNPVRSFLSRVTGGLVSSPDRSWRVGAESEEAVGRELAKLGSQWVVVHDRMIGRRWNADHVVVGPPGAFVLDTKFRSGDVKTSKRGIVVDGRKSDMAEQVQEQAREINARLSEVGLRTWIQPVLVFLADVRGTREPDGVHVVGLDDLVEYLTRLPRELAARDVKEIGTALRDDATWE